MSKGPNKANLNREVIKRNWLEKNAILSLGDSKPLHDTSHKGRITQCDTGYFFKGGKRYYQILLKRVTITDSLIEGVLISTGQVPVNEKGIKVYGVIEKI